MFDSQSEEIEDEEYLFDSCSDESEDEHEHEKKTNSSSTLILNDDDYYNENEIITNENTLDEYPCSNKYEKNKNNSIQELGESLDSSTLSISNDLMTQIFCVKDKYHNNDDDNNNNNKKEKQKINFSLNKAFSNSSFVEFKSNGNDEVKKRKISFTKNGTNKKIKTLSN